VRSLPEEPLRNACVGDMSVADNMALRNFDRRRWRAARLAVRGGDARRAARADRRLPASRRRARTRPSARLSGGNVQRAVLARELSRSDAALLLVSNPVFGLDFAAVAEIHGACAPRATAAPRCCWSARTSTNCCSCPTASW
jgi:ABC-type uncharacterized transport system ATPase subunit